jgi:hypothetical protein
MGMFRHSQRKKHPTSEYTSSDIPYFWDHHADSRGQWGDGHVERGGERHDDDGRVREFYFYGLG